MLVFIKMQKLRLSFVANTIITKSIAKRTDFKNYLIYYQHAGAYLLFESKIFFVEDVTGNEYDTSSKQYKYSPIIFSVLKYLP